MAFIWLLALALRLAHLFDLHSSPFFSVLIVDGDRYDTWAQQIAGGHWLGTDVFYQTPLYPYWLAALYWLFGHHVLLVRIVQAIIGASSCVLLAAAGRRFFSARVGVLAGLLLAIYPESIFWDGLVQKSSLDLAFMTLLVLLLSLCLTRPRRRWLVAIGLVLGAFMLNRENARLLYPVVIGWLFVYFRDVPLRGRLMWAALVTVSAALIVVPVGLRNYVVGGEFLLSTSQLGPNFYIGNHQGASGMYDPLVPDHGNPLDERDDAKALAEQASGRALSPTAVSTYWLGRALEEIGRQPGAWLRLVGRKILLTLNARELVDSESMEEYAEYSRPLRALGWIGFGVVLPLAVLGAWITRDRWRTLSILYGIGGALALSLLLFYVVSRYRFPLVPVVLLFAAAAIDAMPRIGVAWRQWVPGLIAALVIAALAYVPMTAASNTTHDNVGAALVLADRAADAIPVLQRAVAIVPSDARAHYDLGVALEHTGDRENALREFQTAVQLRPDLVEAQDAFASGLRAAGRRAEAVEHAAAAVRLRPDAARLHINYASALAEAGQLDDAVDEFRAALRLEPDNFVAHANFADVLVALGRTQQAIQEYRAAEPLAPDSPDVRLALLGKLAQAYAQAGQTPETIATLERALALAQASGRDDLAARLREALRGRRR